MDTNAYIFKIFSYILVRKDPINNNTACWKNDNSYYRILYNSDNKRKMLSSPLVEMNTVEAIHQRYWLDQ